MRKNIRFFFCCLPGLLPAFSPLHAQERILHNVRYAAYSIRFDTLHTEYLLYDTVRIVSGKHILKINMSGTGGTLSEYYREPLSAGYRQELSAGMPDTTLLQRLEKNAYRRGSGWKRPLAKKKRYRAAGRSYVVYGIPLYNCYDPFCSSRHGHARAQLGYLYFSPGSGVLLEQGNFYRYQVLLQNIPTKLILKLLREGGAGENVCSRYRLDRAGEVGN